MEQKIFQTASLEANINEIEQRFRGDVTVKLRRMENRASGIRFAVFFVDGLVNSLLVNDHILQPLLETSLLQAKEDPLTAAKKLAVPINELKEIPNVDELYSELLSGSTILLAEGSFGALALGVKNLPSRSIQEPEGEKVLKGPREGFTENIIVNLAMIRKKIRTPDLRFEFQQIGTRTGTRCALCYLEGIADSGLLEKLRKKLKSIAIDGILDANYIQELIRDAGFSPFRTSGSTERPDVVAAKLLEGRIALVIDGTPAVITLPFFFLEYFQINDDYYSHYLFGSFGRLLRILGFLFTISFPAFYLALVTHHQNLLPTRLVLNLASARQDLPFSTFWEMLCLILAFELIREGGAHIPSGFGQTLSIVGGLVLGQASVDAKLVSIPVVIIVAFSGIAGLITPQLKAAVIFFRFLFLIGAAWFGLPGFFLCFCLFIWHLSTLKTLDFPYLSSLCSHPGQFLQDTVFRAPWNRMIYRPGGISPTDPVRQKKGTTGRKTHFLLLLFLLFPLLCGCSTLPEINQRSILSAAAFSENDSTPEKGRLHISAEVIKDHRGADSGTPSASVTEGYGNTPFLAAENLNASMQYPLSWAHLRLLALHPSYAAKNDLSSVLSLFLEQEELFLSSDLIVLTPDERDLYWSPQENISGTTLADILTASAETAGTPLCSVAEALHCLASGDCDLLLPAAVLEGKEYRVTGSAVFSGERLRGFLSSPETFCLQLLREEAKEGTVSLPGGNTFRIFAVSIRKTPQETASSARFDITVEGSFTKDSPLASSNPETAALQTAAWLRRDFLSAFETCKEKYASFPIPSSVPGQPLKELQVYCTVQLTLPPSKGGLL